jgi:uncharacterized protein YwqG
MNKDWAIDLIRQAEVSRDAEQLIADLLPSVRIRARPASYTLGLGESRLGGCPDLPRGLPWPRYFGPTRVADLANLRMVETPPREVWLHFIAQVRLEDLPDLGETPLPRRGSLCFFYDAEHQPWGFDPADHGRWRVLYFDEPETQLVRTENPQPGDSWQAPMCQVSFSVEWTLPDYGTQRDHGGHDWDWCESVEELAQDLRLQSDDGDFEAMHRLLGHPQTIQNDMRLECELASQGLSCGDPSGFNDPRAKALQAGAKDWRLLLQVDSEDAPGWMWGDCGRIYYWMREEDMRQRRWDAAWLVLQCS